MQTQPRPAKWSSALSSQTARKGRDGPIVLRLTPTILYGYDIIIQSPPDCVDYDVGTCP